MAVVDRFSRREIMELTGATSNQLQSLDRAGLVVPERIWNDKKKPEVYYNWQQLLEIKAIRNLRESTSLQTIRKVLDFFEKVEVDKTLKDKRILVLEDQVFWIEKDLSDIGKQIFALKVADKRNRGIGQYTLLVLPAFQEIIDQIWEAASKSEVIDLESFRKRAKTQSRKAS